MSHFITTRQMHLIEPSHAKSTQANTILVTGVPTRFLNQASLYHLFSDLPGGVKKIWINRYVCGMACDGWLTACSNLKELPDIYDRRMAACAKLESAETALLRTAAELRQEKIKKGEPQQADIESAAAVEAAAIAVPKDKRPTHRLGFLGLWGEKVDSIDWAREEIQTCNKLLEEARQIIEHEDQANDDEEEEDGRGGKGKDVALKDVQVAKERKYPPLNSAFITFHRQIAAHLAAQALLHHKPYTMGQKYTEVNPEDVIWSNLGMNPYEQKVRMVISYSATAALIIFWAIPGQWCLILSCTLDSHECRIVAFVGVISNIYTVCQKAPFLAWICKLPKEVVGIISVSMSLLQANTALNDL